MNDEITKYSVKILGEGLQINIPKKDIPLLENAIKEINSIIEYYRQNKNLDEKKAIISVLINCFFKKYQQENLIKEITTQINELNLDLEELLT